MAAGSDQERTGGERPRFHGDRSDEPEAASSTSVPEVRTDDLALLLRSHGVDEDEIALAGELGTLELLALERILEGPGPRYDLETTSQLSDIPVERVLALWRALGFPEPRPEEQVFTDLDVEMLIETIQFLDDGEVDLDLTLQMTRVIGSSVARIATALVESISAESDNRRRDELEEEASEGSDDATASEAGAEPEPDRAEPERMVGDPAEPGEEDADGGRVDFEFPYQVSRSVEGDVAERAAALMPLMPKIMEYVWRRHTANAARRRAVRAASGGASTCVGFADLVGFTARTQQLEQRELAEVVRRFEAIAHDLVTRRGGRVIKMIGDEVMFSADDICDAVDIALDMAETYGSDEALSDVRVGLAAGEVLERDGDLFGPVVNMASRIVKVAYPGAVVVSPEIAREADSSEGLVAESIRSHYLKDIGKVGLSVIRRVGTEPGSDEGRSRLIKGDRRDFVLSRRRDLERDAAELGVDIHEDLGRHLADGAFLDDPTEELEIVTDAVLNAEIDVELQIDLLTDIEAARRLDALQREAVERAAEADAEAERKVSEAEQQARRRVLAIEREARRRIEEVLAEAEAKAARANDEASRKVEAVARNAERKADQAERGARRQAERKASRRRRSGRSTRSGSERRSGAAGRDVDRSPVADLSEELRIAMEDVAEAARQAAEGAREALARTGEEITERGSGPGGATDARAVEVDADGAGAADGDG